MNDDDTMSVNTFGKRESMKSVPSVTVDGIRAQGTRRTIVVIRHYSEGAIEMLPIHGNEIPRWSFAMQSSHQFMRKYKDPIKLWLYSGRH